uniref:Uncharacterized protein n=1 Tax=Romanomermis culicivorax TaxID=13658 RepID=A0A915I4S5_ROMCU
MPLFCSCSKVNQKIAIVLPWVWHPELDNIVYHICKDNPYCYQRFYFGQIAVRVPSLQYPIDMSEDATKENQKKSVLVYQPEYVLGYEPPFFELTLPSDAPGIQITHIGNKVAVTPIFKQPSVPVTGTK